MAFLHVQVGCVFLLMFYMLFFCRQKIYLFMAVAVYVLSVLLTGAYLLADAFTGVGVTDAVLFHLLYGLDGLRLFEFFPYVLASVALLVGLVASILLFWRAVSRRNGKVTRYKLAELVALGAVCLFAVVLHPAALQSAEIASEVMDSVGIPLEDELLGFEPAKVEGGRRKNLVYIYVESLERIFLRNDIFPGLAPNLAALEQESLRISGIGQAPLTDWTIAGMVASQCGIPLATFKVDRNDFSDVGKFMPGATCLGEILQQEGYHSVFMGGADLNFAGKGRFYKEHGFSEVIGRHELESASPEVLPLSKWGVYDDVLLDDAYEQFKRLADSGQPFALFMLTLDTHPPFGHETPACNGQVYGDGVSRILSAVKCSDQLVSDFVRKIERYSKDDLIVVVASDHLQMRNDIYDFLVARDAQRENLFFVRGQGIEPRLIERSATTLDIFPTILHLLGWEVQGVALGRSLLGTDKTLVEKYGKETFYTSLQKWRMQLWQAWSPRSGS